MIRFLHILFVEFAENLLRLKSCYDTDGKNYNLLGDTFLNKYK